MSFINKQGDAAINMKLTTIGRQLLAYGSLNFSKFAVGDSEIDYQSITNDSYDGSLSMILRPVDNQPDIKYPIPKISQDTVTKYPVTVPYPSDNQIVNSARERGFFSRVASDAPYKLNTTSTYIRKAVNVVGGIDGGRNLTLSAESGAAAGDMLYIQWFTPNNTNSGTTAGNLIAATPSTFIWYKVLSVDVTNVSVDRPVPDFDGKGGNGIAYVFPGGDSIKSYYGPDSPGDYWDENLLAFNATQNATYVDVPVWNLSIVYGQTVAGASDNLQHNGYPTKVYEGLRTYLSNSYGLAANPSPVGVVHYTNYTVENYYGEGFFKDTFTIELPTIMYHGQNSAKLGVTLKAGGVKKSLSNFGAVLKTPFYDLYDGNNRVVGKVLIDMKIAIIEDSEILAALSYTSNRNWTLPALKNPIVRPDDVLDNDAAQTLWFTYRFTNGNANSYDTTATSYGFQETLHCQKYQYVERTLISDLEYVEFKFDYNDLKFIIDSSNMSTNNGSGFVANKLIFMFQTTPVLAQPVHDRWIEIDYTPNLQNYNSFTNGAITRASLSSQNYRVSGDAIRTAIQQSTTGVIPYYEIDYLGNGDNLNFGEEVFLLGNIKTDIQATTYQSRFSILLNAAEFSTSRNPTWSLGTPVYVSELAVYDDKDNLVASGKLNYPMKKDAYSLRFITADLDF